MLQLVINLDRSPERWTSMQCKLRRFNIQPERISAVDGQMLTNDEIKSIAQPLTAITKIACPRELLPGEIGCFLSHRKCWQKLVDSNEQWALILEDDINFSDRAENYLSNIDWIPQGVHIVQLHIWGKQWESQIDSKRFKLENGDELLHPCYPRALGTQAYFISKAAAKQALLLSQKISSPVDNFLSGDFSPLSKLYPTYRLNPAVVTTTEFPSLINSDNKIKALPYSKDIKNHPLRRWIKIKLHIYRLLFTKHQTFIYK